MNKKEADDTVWLAEILENSTWLFYGEFEVYLNAFLKQIFKRKFSDYGFDEKLPNDFQVAYWSVLSEMEALRFMEYGTSPRGGWLTNEGERFKNMILSRENALQDAQDFTYQRYNKK